MILAVRLPSLLRLSILLVSSITASVAAQDRDGRVGEDPAEGQRLLQAAVEAGEAGDLVAAESLLRRSLDAHAWTFPAFKLAETLEDLGRPLGALEVYEALEAGEYGEVEGQARERVREAAARAAARVARMQLSWGPVGRPVSIRVDGALVAETTEDHATVRANPGVRLVQVETVAFPVVERRVRLEEGAATEVAIVWPDGSLVGRLRLRTDAGALLRLGDEEGRGTLDLHLPPGTYPVRVRNQAGELEHEVAVRGGELSSYDLKAPSASGRGWIWALVGVAVAGAVAVAVGFALRGGASSLPVDDIGT